MSKEIEFHDGQLTNIIFNQDSIILELVDDLKKKYQIILNNPIISIQEYPQNVINAFLLELTNVLVNPLNIYAGEIKDNYLKIWFDYPKFTIAEESKLGDFTISLSKDYDDVGAIFIKINYTQIQITELK